MNPHDPQQKTTDRKPTQEPMTLSDYQSLAQGPWLQERYAPQNKCFGCGPANPQGLQIRSYALPHDQGLFALFQPAAHHLAFDGVLNGGIIGTLLDCHCNWTALYALMLDQQSSFPPCTVTADYHIKLRRVTPVDATLLLRARAVEIKGDRATVEGDIEANGKITATCSGTFIAVKEGHPAFHRWGPTP